jgi:hypothetical protein
MKTINKNYKVKLVFLEDSEEVWSGETTTNDIQDMNAMREENLLVSFYNSAITDLTKIEV